MSQPDADSFAWASPALREQLRTDPRRFLQDRGITAPPEMPDAAVIDFARIVGLLWVEGRVISFDEFRIDPSDEGLLFGRGVWESTRTINGVPWLWNWHLDRLLRTAELLKMPLRQEQLPSVQQVTDYVRGLSNQDVIVRLNATAGRPGHHGIIWMSAAPRPAPRPFLRLKSMANPVQKGQAYLTLKTFQYATRLRIGQQVQGDGFDSALMIDEAGNVQEAAHANIFFRVAEGWITPAADNGFLPGTVRQYLLQKAPLKIREDVFPRSRLAEVQEAFATNSNVGLIPVVQIDDATYAIGPETQNLMRWLHPPEPPGVQYRFAETAATPR